MPVRDFINVTASASAAAGRGQDFGRALLLTEAGSSSSARLAARNSEVRSYTQQSDLEVDWPTGEPKDAGAVYFAQRPYPRGLLVGAHLPGGQNSHVFGTAANLATLRTLSTWAGGAPRGAAVAGGTVYLVDSAGRLHSLDPTSGATKPVADLNVSGVDSMFAIGNDLYYTNGLALSKISNLATVPTIEALGNLSGTNVTDIVGSAAGSTKVYFLCRVGSGAGDYRLFSQTTAKITGTFDGAMTAIGSSDIANIANPTALLYQGGSGATAYGVNDDGQLVPITISSGAGGAKTTASAPKPAGAGFYTGSKYYIVTATEVTEVSTAAAYTGGQDLYNTVTLELEGSSVELSNAVAAASTLADVASDLQANGRSDISSLVVEVDSGRLVLTADQGTFTAGFGDNAFSRAMGVSPRSGAAVTAGSASESITNSLARINTLNSAWYFLLLDKTITAVDASVQAAATWAAANRKMLVVNGTSYAPGSTLQKLSLKQSPNVVGIYSASDDYKAASLAARFAAVNLDGAGQLPTAKFQQLPGTTPDDLSATVREALDGLNINYYADDTSPAIVREGRSFGGWMDVQYWVDWLVQSCQAALFALVTANAAGRGRVPQTTVGTAALRGALDRTLAQGVRNGGCAPGQLQENLAGSIRQITGNDDFDGFLSLGYLSHVGALADQAQSDREARKAPPAYVWAKLSGAIHSIDVQITFES